MSEIINPQTGLTMQLRHYQHGPCAVRGEPEPSPGGVYVFMSSEDPISRELELNGITPSATITVIHHRMEDWRCVLPQRVQRIPIDSWLELLSPAS